MLALIAATDLNGVIGDDGELPWTLPSDLRFFQLMTEHHWVVMGRKTFESIGSKPLKNRHNYVMTRDKDFKAPQGVTLVSNVDYLLDFAKVNRKVFIIGGSEIFKIFLPHADRLYLTTIKDEFDGDVHFPDVNLDEWKNIWRAEGIVDDKNKYEHQFNIYERK